MATVLVNGTVTTEGAIAALTEMLAAAIGTASMLHLYKSSFVPGKESVEADFVGAEADFNTYAAQAVTFGPVGIDATGSPFVATGVGDFQNVSGASPNTIGGAWIETQVSSGPAVHKSLIFFQFANPVEMSHALQAMSFSAVFQGPPLSAYGILDY